MCQYADLEGLSHAYEVTKLIKEAKAIETFTDASGGLSAAFY